MPAFVTQTLDEQLGVLVVSQDTSSTLTNLVVNTFQQNGFTTKVVGASLNDLNTAFSAGEYYKIILIYQSNYFNTSQNYKDTLSFLASRPEKTMVFGSLTTPVESKVVVFKQWEEVAKHQDQVLGLLDSYKQSFSWCMGLDLVESPAQAVWISGATHLFSRGEVLDPQLEIFPQLETDFVAQASSRLLAPWKGQRSLFKGFAVNSTVFISKLIDSYQRIYQVKLRSVKVEVFSSELPDYKWEIVSSRNNLLDVLVSEVSAQLPKLTPQATSMSDSSEHGESARKHQTAALPQPVVSALEDPQRAVVEQQTSQPPRTPEIARQEEAPQQPVKTSVTSIYSPRPKSVQKRSSQGLVNTNREDDQNSEKHVTEALQKLFEDTQVEHKVSRVTKVAKEAQQHTKKKKKKKRMFYIGMAVVGFGIGLLTLFGTFMTSVFFLEKNLIAFSQQLHETQTKRFAEQTSQLGFWATFVEAQVESYQLVLAESMFQYPRSLLEVSQQLAGVGSLLNDSRDLTQRSIRQVLGSESGDVIETLQAANTRASLVYKQLSQLKAAIEGLDETRLSSSQATTLQDFTELVEEERVALTITQQLQPLLPQLLGFEGKRKYAVLLQDNQELRPTGGFLNSVAIVTLDQGLLVDFQVYSVYQLDQQLGGQVEAPDELREILGESQFYLRDANWQPSLQDSAPQLEWFISKTTGEDVQGLITLDLFAVERIIRATGPLELPEYNEVLTDRNIHERAEFHSEVTLVEEAGERNYLTVVLDKLLNQVVLLQEEKVSGLLSELHAGLQQEHIQVQLSEEGEQTSFEVLGWDGRVISPNCPTPLSGGTCVVDSLLQVEANIGVNKANHYLKRAVAHSISLEGSKANHTRVITYENTARTKAWPKGPYQTYVRFVLSPSADDVEVFVDGKKVSDSGLRVSSLRDRPVVGVVFEVPVQSVAEVELKFSTSLAEGSDAGFSYAFFDQKQAGVDETPSSISISYPPNLVPETIAPQAELQENSVVFSSLKQKHQFVGVAFDQN